MQNLILVFAALIPVVFGFFIMRKLDTFFCNHQGDAAAHSDPSADTEDTPQITEQFYPPHDHRC